MRELDWEYVHRWRLIDAIEEKRATRKAKAMRRQKFISNVVGVLVVWALVILLAVNWDCLYKAKGTVVEVTEEEVVVEIGNDLYAYKGNECNVGDSVVLIMSNNGTEMDKTDDIVILERR